MCDGAGVVVEAEGVLLLHKLGMGLSSGEVLRMDRDEDAYLVVRDFERKLVVFCVLDLVDEFRVADDDGPACDEGDLEHTALKLWSNG